MVEEEEDETNANFARIYNHFWIFSNTTRIDRMNIPRVIGVECDLATLSALVMIDRSIDR